MKPFNLEAALAGKPVVTRGGAKVLVTKLPKPDPQSHHVIFVQREDGSILGTFPESGQWHRANSQYDLFMAPVKKTVYVNWMNPEPNPERASWAFYHPTKELAEKQAARTPKGYFAVAVPVEIEVEE